MLNYVKGNYLGKIIDAGDDVFMSVMMKLFSANSD